MDGLNAVAEEIAAIAGPGRALAVETDITDLKSCANCLRAAVDAFGVLHVLVNNARRLRRDSGKPEAAGHLPFWAVDPVLYRETVEVNVAGTFFMSRTVTPYFIERSYGKIINLTTSLRNFYSVGQSPYGVTKAAINSSTYIWARDLEGKGVTVNALLPGGACDNGDINRPPEPGRTLLPTDIMVTTGAIPITSIDKNRDVALSKVNVKGLINEGNTPAKKTWVRPASGTFSTVADIEGLLMAGTPADVARDTKRYEEAGLNHIVFDLRFRYADWYQQIDLLGKEVLPAVRA